MSRPNYAAPTVQILLTTLASFEDEFLFCCQLYNDAIFTEIYGHVQEIRRLLKCTEDEIDNATR